MGLIQKVKCDGCGREETVPMEKPWLFVTARQTQGDFSSMTVMQDLHACQATCLFQAMGKAMESFVLRRVHVSCDLGGSLLPPHCKICGERRPQERYSACKDNPALTHDWTETLEDA
jgi:hypothetical protein